MNMSTPLRHDPAAIPTLAHAIRALEGRRDRGFTFLQQDGSERTLTFHDAVPAIEARAAQLLGSGLRPGDHLALVIPESDQFVLSFLASIRAGIVPVPMYPPVAFGKLDSYIASTAQIMRAARTRMLLTTRKTQAVLWSLVDQVEGLRGLLTVDALDETQPAPITDPDTLRPDDTAFIQFTSGSTAVPKGVVVTHRNLLTNCAAIVTGALKMDSADKAVSWLPMYHDMGLIGCVVAPVQFQFPAVYIPTVSFIKRPGVWLETMSRHRGTVTFAPNFAYALTARRITDEALAKLELGHVRVLGCGAEPNNPVTLRAFVDRFAAAGLKPSALLPCYGMAEATLGMSFCGLEDPLRTERIDPDAYYSEGRAAPIDGADGETRGVEVVSCGRAVPDHDFVIIDEAGEALPDRHVGEIVFRGPSITAGYFDRPEATREAFTEAGLRTGDLGYLVDGELFVTGRRKDLIILNGRNYDPQSIEWEASEVPGIRKGNVVAFSRPATSSEELVLVGETAQPVAEHEALREAVKRRVQEQLYLTVADVVFLEPGTLPKTTSGKLQRSKTRQQYLEGRLATEGERTMGGTGQKVVLARHVARSLFSRVRHEVRTRASDLKSALAGDLSPQPPSRSGKGE